MDRAIEKKTWSTTRILVAVCVLGLSSLMVYQLSNRSNISRLKVNTERLTISSVEKDEFLEYYPFDARVEPVTSVYIDVEEGGRVDEIFVEGGQSVKKGDLILRISNAALQRNSIDTETRLLENLDRLRNTQFNRAQSQLILRENLLGIDYQIVELEKRHGRYTTLTKKDALSKQELEAVMDELAYLKERRLLLQERIQQENLLSKQQLEQANNSIKRLNISLNMLARIVESLDVRAPISGNISSIDAELGQSLGRGQRIGQVDLLNDFKLRVEIDQYYIAQVDIDSVGHFTLDQKRYQVSIKKIYPEVTNNRFAVDMDFVGEKPEALRRGQTLTVELSFSEPTTSLIVKKGGFYQQTGGRWVYLVASDGYSARRTNLRLGRQNPLHVEVLEGLQLDDRIITSGYDVFNEVDELIFDKPI